MAITISGVNNNDRIVATDGTIDALSGFNVVGVMTAASFSGDLVGNVTGNLTGNVNSTSPLLLQTGGSERIRLTGNTEIGIAGANYGTAGQVLTSGGSGNAVSWTTISGGVTSDSEENTVGGTNAGNALDSDTYRNTLFGHDTGKLINSGDDNTIIGWKAGDAIDSGYKNCAVGSEALPNCNSGHNNVAMGWEAGRSVNSGNNNVMLGPMAGRSIGGGTYNIALGYHSLSNTGSPTRCIGIGGDSVFLGGTDVIGMGQGTMLRGNSQIGGIGIGRYAGRNNAGDYNVYVGYEAGNGTNSSPYAIGNYNISLGYRSLYNITSASSNVAIGASAGDVLTTGLNNIILGDGADASSAAISNEVTIGNSSINHLRVPGIGVSFSTSGNHITGITTFKDRIKLGNSGNGELYYSGGIKMVSTAQIELESANQMYLKAQSSGLFLFASNQEVVSVYGGSGGGVYFKHNNIQKLKLEGGNWTYLNNATVTHASHVYIPDSIIHVGDTNTKIRFPADDTITAETGGTERLRITSGGQVNIGTGELTQTDRMLNLYGGRMRIGGISSGNSFEIMNSASAGQSNGILCQAGTNSSDINATFRNTSGATLFRIRGDGNIGINEASPLARLHVKNGESNASGYAHDTIVVEDSDHAFLTFLTGTSGSSGINFGDAGDPQRGVIQYDQSNDYMRFITGAAERLRINADGQIHKRQDTTNRTALKTYSGEGLWFDHYQLQVSGTYRRYADIAAVGDGSWGSVLRFHTMPDSGSATERLRIHSDGKIAIGSIETSTGLLLLDKTLTAESDASDKNNYHLVIRSQTNSNTSKIGIAFANTSDDTHVGAAILHHRESTDSIGSLAFYTSPSSGTTTERMKIDRNGHVLPGSNNAYDLGSSSLRWRNVYTTDLQLSNEGKTNDVDGTWGNYTIQEGESDLFLINNRNGKKYKFNLTEVS